MTLKGVTCYTCGKRDGLLRPDEAADRYRELLSPSL